jgi:hypothetical protein
MDALTSDIQDRHRVHAMCNDMRIKGVSMEVTSDRREWKKNNMLCRAHLVGLWGNDNDDELGSHYNIFIVRYMSILFILLSSDIIT